MGVSDEDKRRLLTRRQVVEGCAAAGALFVFGSAAHALEPQEDRLRPPGAQDVQRLLASCIRCDRCRAACPTGAIGVGKMSAGVLNGRLPEMDFRSGWCDMCGGEYRCAAACPTGAIGSFDDKRDKIGVAVVDEDVCQLFGVSAHCSAACIDACAYRALSLDAYGRLEVDEDRCNGCGACEAVCPSNSYGNYQATGGRGINVRTWEGGRA